MNLDLVDKMYKDYKISKGNGKFRLIQAPNDELKDEQRRILKEVLNNINVHRAAFGFTRGKSIFSNAKYHLGAEFVLEMDMKNFFDTVTKEDVKNALVNNYIEEGEAEYISRVCTRYGTTPQGAPTSPALTNIVCKPMDKKIERLCRENGFKYTRYADDITISTILENGFDLIQELKPKATSIINKYGFIVNGTKTKTVGKYYPQSVTGVIINEKIDISRKAVMNFRAKVYNALHDTEAHMDRNLFNKRYDGINSLKGYANFIYNANPTKYKKYVDQVKLIETKLSALSKD